MTLRVNGWEESVQELVDELLGVLVELNEGFGSRLWSLWHTLLHKRVFLITIQIGDACAEKQNKQEGEEEGDQEGRKEEKAAAVRDLKPS